MGKEGKKFKVYTRSGDKGATSLIGGTRVKKNTPKVEAYGTIDELKSHIGLIHSMTTEELGKEKLYKIMIQLFVAESLVASDSEKSAARMPQLSMDDIHFLESEIDAMDDELPPLTAFILPSGDELASQCHIARTICRRAERRSIDLTDENPFILPVTQYLNRLSDYLFIYARWICKKRGIEEVKWDGKQS